MKATYLEVTFRHGRPIAAYYYLPRRARQRSSKTRRLEPGARGSTTGWTGRPPRVFPRHERHEREAYGFRPFWTVELAKTEVSIPMPRPVMSREFVKTVDKLQALQ